MESSSSKGFQEGALHINEQKWKYFFEEADLGVSKQYDALDLREA